MQDCLAQDGRIVQGGTQGLSRSLFAMVIQYTGDAQNAILSIIGFFFIGGLILTRVNVEEGRRAAREAEAGVRTS